MTVVPDRFLAVEPASVAPRGNPRLPDLPGADLELNGPRG
jgi:hypothetical protein